MTPAWHLLKVNANDNNNSNSGGKHIFRRYPVQQKTAKSKSPPNAS